MAEEREEQFPMPEWLRDLRGGLSGLVDWLGDATKTGAGWGAAIGTFLNRDGRRVLGDWLRGFGFIAQRAQEWGRKEIRSIIQEAVLLYGVKWFAAPIASIFIATLVEPYGWRVWVPIFTIWVVVGIWQLLFWLAHVRGAFVAGSVLGAVKTSWGFSSPRESFEALRKLLVKSGEGGIELVQRFSTSLWSEFAWWVIVMLYAMAAPYSILPPGILLFSAGAAVYLVLANNASNWGNRDADGNLVRNRENKPAMPTAHRYLITVAITILIGIIIAAWITFGAVHLNHSSEGTGRGAAVAATSAANSINWDKAWVSIENWFNEQRWKVMSGDPTLRFWLSGIIGLIMLIWCAQRPARILLAVGIVFLGWILSGLPIWWWIIGALAVLAIVQPRVAPA